MNFSDRIASSRGRLAGTSLILSGALWLEPTAAVRGQDGIPMPVRDRHFAASRPAGPVSAPEVFPVGLEGPATRPVSDIRSDGIATPGSRVTIGITAAPDPDVSYQWVQIDGPPVTIADPTKPKIEITIPADARSLGFLLTMNDGKLQRTARFTIPIENTKRADANATNRSDAGDDQVGLVGRRITLNGSGSGTPRQGASCRWFQLAGPKVEKAAQEGYYYSFVPMTPGVYRFGLVVATGGGSSAPTISEMDEVLVTVGELPTAFGGTATAGISNGVSTVALDQMLQGPGSITARATLDQVAAILEAIAGRASLYTSFADLSSEMMRRIDGVMPTDANTRQFWSSAVFAQLTQHITTEMLAVGLDLRTPQAVNTSLSPLQQDKLQKLFNYYAREFRSRTQGR
jgi:hypothetical protein